MWCWRRLLRVPWTARRSNQSIPKEISPEYSLEGLMLKLKLQYFGHLMWRTDLFEKTLLLERLKAGGEGDKRGWDAWTASPTQWTWVWASSGSWWWTGKPGMLQSMGVTKSNKWTESRANGLFHRLWWYLARMYSAQHCVIVVKLIVATTLILLSQLLLGLPWRLSGKEYTCHCRRRRFNPWVWKIPWRRKWQLTPVFFLGKPMDRWVWQATVYGVAKEPDPVTKQQQSPKGKS